MSNLPLEKATKEMKIERHFVAEMSIYKFGALNGLVMEVHERDTHDLHSPTRFYAHFQCAEVKTGIHGLLSNFGDGKTERDAINAYAKEISLKILVLHAMDPKRRIELKVPRLV